MYNGTTIKYVHTFYIRAPGVMFPISSRTLPKVQFIHNINSMLNLQHYIPRADCKLKYIYIENL